MGLIALVALCHEINLVSFGPSKTSIFSSPSLFDIIVRIKITDRAETL